MAVRFLRGRQAPKGDSSLKLRKFWVALCLFVRLAIFTDITHTGYTNAIDAYKIYAHIKVGSYKEFVCLEKLWTKESNWRYKAKNKQVAHMEYHSY
jgi:hypothetical protein